MIAIISLPASARGTSYLAGAWLLLRLASELHALARLRNIVRTCLAACLHVRWLSWVEISICGV
jgi:hypothetical protein